MSSAPIWASEVSPGLRKFVWDSMLDGEMNDRYWRARSAAYVLREKALKIFLAVTSSGTVASWAIWKTAHVPWQILAAMSALLGIALPILDYTGQVERASDIRKGWWELTQEYRHLWAVIDTNSSSWIDEQVKPLKTKETELSKIESKYFNRDEALIRKCQEDVLRAQGLPIPK